MKKQEGSVLRRREWITPACFAAVAENRLSPLWQEGSCVAQAGLDWAAEYGLPVGDLGFIWDLSLED